MIYQTAKLLINAGRMERDHLLSCLDIFLMAERITAEQYTELFLLIPVPSVVEQTPELPTDPAPTAPDSTEIPPDSSDVPSDSVSDPNDIPDTAPVEVPMEEFLKSQQSK